MSLTFSSIKYVSKPSRNFCRRLRPHRHRISGTGLTDIVDRRLNRSVPGTGGFTASTNRDNERLLPSVEVDAACEMACEIAMKMMRRRQGLRSPGASAVWSARAFILGDEGRQRRSGGCDVVVPRARIADFVRAAQDIGRKCKIRVIVCGHAGDGSIHTEMLRRQSLRMRSGNQYRVLPEELYAKVRARRTAVGRTAGSAADAWNFSKTLSAAGCISCAGQSTGIRRQADTESGKIIEYK